MWSRLAHTTRILPFAVTKRVSAWLVSTLQPLTSHKGPIGSRLCSPTCSQCIKLAPKHNHSIKKEPRVIHHYQASPKTVKPAQFVGLTPRPKEGRRTMILYVLSSLALVSSLMVVRAKNPVHSVLFPIPVFRNTSGLLLLLGLDSFTMIFIVVYIGAIAISFLFVVMMFHIQIAEIHEEVLHYLPVSGIIGLIFWWEMFFILDNESISLLPTQRNTTSLRYMVFAGKVRSWTNLETLGNLLYTYYSVWFLVPSLILLVAMIGAIVLTMHRTTKVKRQDVFRRNAINSRRTIMRGMTNLLNKTPAGSCVVVPAKTALRDVVTSMVVVHCWAVPSSPVSARNRLSFGATLLLCLFLFILYNSILAEPVYAMEAGRPRALPYIDLNLRPNRYGEPAVLPPQQQ
ncbi:NADH dehydrogenase subunit 6, mitochondrion [Artemisia annua]|uniref:NADH-ubiquinone oxidoreductase chain 6 n=1 Tax=Artemisia annua TaxID=35608 RepID=A0A2U1Q899_ARTAN|nr:NADH dehydrogenase subunit 6, mitochondrion [Artemisia annua]